MTSLADDLRWAADPVTWCIDVHGFHPDPWQARFLRSDKKQIILKCARQTGKSTIVGLRIAHRVRFRPKFFSVCIAPSDRQSLELFDKIRAPLRKSGDLEVTSKDNLHEIVLSNSSRVVCLPSNADTIRGFSKVDELLEDEAAMVEDDVYHAVRPMLMVSRGSIVLMSTPKGQRGHFHDAWIGSGDWDRYEVRASECPRSSAEFLANEKKELGEWMYRQEYECEFLSTLDAVFPVEQVKSAISDAIECFSW